MVDHPERLRRHHHVVSVSQQVQADCASTAPCDTEQDLPAVRSRDDAHPGVLVVVATAERPHEFFESAPRLIPSEPPVSDPLDGGWSAAHSDGTGRGRERRRGLAGVRTPSGVDDASESGWFVCDDSGHSADGLPPTR